MWRLLSVPELDVYAFVVVLTVSAFGMATPVRNVVELWLILKKRSSGHKNNNPQESSFKKK
jgi:hypothetical protein